MAFLINATGKELSSDMACSSTKEAYRVDEKYEVYFFNEDNALTLQERVDGIVEFSQKYPSEIKGFILENNELGKKLHSELKDKFVLVKSTKRPTSNLHWFWEKITNMDF